MVTITNVLIREGKEGKPFVALEITGDIEMLQFLKPEDFMPLLKNVLFPPPFPRK